MKAFELHIILKHFLGYDCNGKWLARAECMLHCYLFIDNLIKRFSVRVAKTLFWFLPQRQILL